MAKPSLIIFDCDGVLVDSEMLWNEVFAASLANVGFKLSREQVLNEYVGMSRLSATAKIEAQHGVKVSDSFWEDARAATFKLYEKKLKPIPGAVELVKALPMKKCVASSNGPKTLRYTLDLVELWDSFASNVFSSEQVKNGKPAPDLFLFAAKKMKSAPSSCLVIEDSIAGIHAAKAANMRVFGFTGGSHCGAGHADVLKNEGAEQVFATMAEIAEVLI